ncbi:P-loop containing nucleoside triphosphate hydrolase protein [Lasiosphaeris hirsuta]|uniref:P-loop containing nucleoside triphosphate hydrolase protein n=1 Tax=Lasiosphaeris hirsuta TaxID=260670 RepID=A0AA40AGG5_9PEZI|nr:P-loop containing nucleoside triphosphate hydrolase protein [Lasiosphaeris hirsuta]
MVNRCAGDGTFGPALGHGPSTPCYEFDFTLVFEDSIFSIAPCAIVLLLAASRLHQLWRRPVLVNWPLIRTSKWVAYGIQAALQLALVVLLWATNHSVRTSTTLASGMLALLSTLALLGLSDLEHSQSLHPSAILQSFFVSTSLLDLPRVRTQWLLENNSAIASVFTTTFALRILLLALESLPKWKHATISTEDIPPEMRQGILGQTFFWWLKPLLLEGYKRDLTMQDLHPVDDALKGGVLRTRLLRSWDKVDKAGKNRLRNACLQAFFPELVKAFIPRTFRMGFDLAQPFLISSTLHYISDHENAPAFYGHGLIGAYGLCYVGIAISGRWYMYTAYRTMAKVRGGLVATIYRDMLTIRAESANSSAALSLMSTDVDRVTMSSYIFVNVVPNLLQIAIALYILGIQLGATAVAPIILCVACAAVAARVSKLVPPRQGKWMAAIQKRVGITSDIIASMKGVKVAGLSEKVESQVQGLRDFELMQSIQYRKLQIGLALLGIAPTLLLPAVTFTIYAIVQEVSGGSQFGVAQAFTSLSLLAILLNPVMELTVALPQLSAASTCIDRIQAFLLKEKRIDYRKLFTPSGLGSSASSRELLKGGNVHDDQANSDEVAMPWIKIRGGNFGWSPDGPAIVKDIDLDIMPGELTLLVGPVASGKSTLLKALLGESYILSGSVEFTVPEDVAYCDQDAWLLNQSIKENILAFSEYDKGFYDQVIRACQLNEDLEQLPSRDDTMIGSKGISLSGGQKQRVALARAVYNRKPIVIMDDILKGLDADTYSKCFAAVMGPEGLLRRGRTAIILATHNIQLLPHAQHVIILGEDGRIVEKGSFQHLNVSLDGYVSGLGLSHSVLRGVEAAVAKEIQEEEADKRALLTNVESSRAQKKDKATKDDNNGVSRGRRSADAMLSYIRSMGDINFLVYCAFTVCSFGTTIAQPLWLNVWASANEASLQNRIGYYAGINVLIGMSSVVALALQFGTMTMIIIPHSAKTLHKRILDAAMHAPMSFFVATDTGEIVNRFSQDMTLVDIQLPISFMMTSSNITGSIAQLALTCAASGWLALTIPPLLLLLFFLQKFYLRTSRQMRLLDLEAKSPLYSYFISSFQGLAALRAYGWTQRAEEENLNRLDRSQRPYYLLYCIQRWLALVLDLMVAGLAVLLVGLAVALKDQINPGLLGVALTSIMTAGQQLSMVIQNWTQLETSLGAVTRVNRFEADTPREEDGPDMPGPGWPWSGAIRVSGLSAKYGDRTVLSNVNLDIAPGQKVAVCGRSGSGKSTLMMLLLRLYQPESGTIAIDGTDTATLRLDRLRESLVVLPQDPMFLAGTVRYNLDPTEKCADDEALAVLEKTGVRGVIEEHGGLDAELNTDWLSAGQRQLFCLARALLRRSRVLLLDEATSSLDRRTEGYVNDIIRTEFAHWTVLVVTHRLQTIVDFDAVVVLQDGCIVEYGSPKELLAEDNSMFKALWDLQEA